MSEFTRCIYDSDNPALDGAYVMRRPLRAGETHPQAHADAWRRFPDAECVQVLDDYIEAHYF